VRQIEISFDVVAPAGQVSVGGEHMLQTLFLAHDLLGSLGIRPQIRVGSLLLNLG